jgi:hypothetical protein
VCDNAKPTSQANVIASPVVPAVDDALPLRGATRFGKQLFGRQSGSAVLHEPERKHKTLFVCDSV